ncbi:6881_t:CDS:1, partial [Racocetra persica]
YKHMDQLRNSSTTSSAEHVISPNSQDNSYQHKFSRDPFSKKGRSYNLTRAAAIKMVTFSLLFAFVNLLACIPSFSSILKNQHIESEPGALDFIGTTLGIYVFLVFGWPHNLQKVKQ